MPQVALGFFLDQPIIRTPVGQGFYTVFDLMTPSTQVAQVT